MRIIYHHRTQGKGVEGVHIRNIVKALRDLNHNVTVISPSGFDPMQEGSKKSENSSKSIKTAFSLLSRNCPEIFFEFIELIYNIPAFFKINREVKKRRIDLIYERYFLFSIASILISKKYNIPIIYEVNDSSFVPRLRQLEFVKIANFIERKVFSVADSLITVSNHLKNRLVKAGILAERITVSHNAVDPDTFNPAKVKHIDLGIPADLLILGFVGLFVKWVGLESLIRLYYRIHSDYPETHLLLVGSGPEQKNLREFITGLGLQSNVTITGTVQHKEIPSYINKMDICIILKHERYTSPVKLFEYMAMGKATLVPAYESIREVIEHGRNGMLFESDDENHFVVVLRELITNKKLLKSLGVNARRDILKKYTWHQNALRIEREVDRIRPSLSNTPA